MNRSRKCITTSNNLDHNCDKGGRRVAHQLLLRRVRMFLSLPQTRRPCLHAVVCTLSLQYRISVTSAARSVYLNPFSEITILQLAADCRAVLVLLPFCATIISDSQSVHPQFFGEQRRSHIQTPHTITPSPSPDRWRPTKRYLSIVNSPFDVTF